MMPDPKKSDTSAQDEKFPPADYGNASNPSPHPDEAPQENQLLDKHAEKYLREVANIEDEPDAQDQEEMDETIRQAKNSKPKQ